MNKLIIGNIKAIDSISRKALLSLLKVDFREYNWKNIKNSSKYINNIVVMLLLSSLIKKYKYYTFFFLLFLKNKFWINYINYSAINGIIANIS